MNLITTEHLTHSYTERKLFDDASFSLNEQEKEASALTALANQPF